MSNVEREKIHDPIALKANAKYVLSTCFFDLQMPKDRPHMIATPELTPKVLVLLHHRVSTIVLTYPGS